MNRDRYIPGPARAELVHRDGEQWQFVLSKQLRHSPTKVWKALTDPAQLREWAPFDADADLGVSGARVRLSTVGTPRPHVVETTITRAEEPHVLEYNWGGNDMRWELEDYDGGTRLTLWASIHRNYVAMGAAGWQLCLDVLQFALDGAPIGRLAGPEAMAFDGWKQLHADYTRHFSQESPK